MRARMAGAMGPRLHTLYERDRLPVFELPEPLRRGYGGDLGFDESVVYANFVSTLDGVVSMGPRVKPSVISGKSPADRFVMALLRACADAVLVGAGTLRAEPRHVWLAEHVDPDRREAYGELRRALGLQREPELFVLTVSGHIDPTATALERGAIVLTSERGAGRLRDRLPEASSVVVLAERAEIPAASVVRAVRERGHRRVLTEGGPTVIGWLLRERLLDEMFLTLSPRLAGRAPGAARMGLVEGFALPPDALVDAELLAVRRGASHLFLRYRLRT